MRSVAVVGSGISGLVAAYELAKAGLKVCLYEKDDKLGGHANTTATVDGVQLDLAFTLFNRVTSPNMMELFENLGIEMEGSDMSYSVSLEKGLGCEWGSRNGLSSVFAQKSNLLNPYFWKMLRELTKFKNHVLIYLDEMENNPEMDDNITLDNFVKSRGYSELFQTTYLIPICASIWPCRSQQVMDFPAFSILSWFRNNQMLQLSGGPQWLAVKGRSHCYVNQIVKELKDRGCQIRIETEVDSVSTSDEGCTIHLGDGSKELYDGCILAIHASDALKLLGHEATHDETRILGAFQYAYSDIFLHQDKGLMPQNPATWSACNFLGSSENEFSITYWLNVMQNIDKGDQPFLVTLNPFDVPKNVLLKWSNRRLIPSVAAAKASIEMNNIQGKREIWFCSGYQGYGFYEAGLKAGMVIAHAILGRSCNFLQNPVQMVTSWTESASRLVTNRFLQQFISVGCLILLEDGGGIFTFQGTRKKYAPKVVIRVHNPQFYWKVCTEADLGFADAYINGDFSLVDKNEGLLNLFMLFVANRDLNSHASRLHKKRGWWTPMLFTSGIASAKYYYSHFLRRNTITQARRNISRHYDMGNDMFSLFLDETMTYSCAMFKSPNEDLKEAQLRKLSVLIEKGNDMFSLFLDETMTYSCAMFKFPNEDLKEAQLRKLSVLIEKAKIEKNHEVLDIGFGWGSLAIETVRRTGCKYTGITLSEEQLKLAEERVKEAGLQDHIKFLLCDYRRLPHTNKYDRILSCEMLEHVGHEFMEDFFRCCDSLLADNGLLVLQFISIPDEHYDEYIKSSDFIREYIFPGGFLPSLSRLTSAMAVASRLCVEKIDNIGIHYFQTLRCWRQNFLKHQNKILSLGFDEKFIRTWEYYFDYCAAGFKSRYIRDYQVIFSRPGNVITFTNPFESKSSSCDANAI